jgi:hypothetical protein
MGPGKLCTGVSEPRNRYEAETAIDVLSLAWVGRFDFAVLCLSEVLKYRTLYSLLVKFSYWDSPNKQLLCEFLAYFKCSNVIQVVITLY